MKSFERKNGAAGFTLIEMAIVLVVIGLIIGAVLKGQDLIANARAKKFANFVRQGEVSQWAYFDRNGKFSNRTVYLSEINDYTNQTVIGASTYYMSLGKSGGKNCLAVAKTWATPTAFSTDDLIYMKSVDAAIDGTANANSGKVYGLTSLSQNATLGEGAFSNPVNGTSSWDTNKVALMYCFD